MVFNYIFKVTFAEGYDITVEVPASDMASAWIGIGYEVSEMPDSPLSIEWVKVK